MKSTLIISLAIYNPPEISILFSERIHKQDKFECKTFEYRTEKKAYNIHDHMYVSYIVYVVFLFVGEKQPTEP